MIPKIPKGQQKPVLQTNMEREWPLGEPYDTITHERLLAGHEKYGVSWCEVNLKQDMLEELYDVLNYTRMYYQRVLELEMFDTAVEVISNLAHINSVIKKLIRIIEDDLPDMEGPTSAEWVKERSETA